MEPARGERDDLTPTGRTMEESTPQWSPLVVSGMTWDLWWQSNCWHWPQWSPLVVSGMTSGTAGGMSIVLYAAMEPARGERDDRTVARCPRPSPCPPQWSPLVVSGMTNWDVPLPLVLVSRNGARSW